MRFIPKFMDLEKPSISTDPITPVSLPRGYGGTGILWGKEINNIVNPLEIGNDILCCVELLGTTKLLLISVYLPCKGLSLDTIEFCNCIDQLHAILQKYSDTHSIIIGGDFNEDVFSKTNTRRNQLDFMSDNILYTEEDGITFVNSSGN